jgi:hypothetical protein
MKYIVGSAFTLSLIALVVFSPIKIDLSTAQADVPPEVNKYVDGEATCYYIYSYVLKTSAISCIK